MQGIGIIKAAHYLPAQLVTNEDVCKHVPGLTPEWIIEKTGIQGRYHCHPADRIEDLALAVANQLVGVSIDINDIGLIVVATFSQTLMFPPMAAYIHSGLNAKLDCQVLDINTNCTGLISATTLAAEHMMANPDKKYAMVIGAEHLSRYVDRADKFSAPWFGDGASGVLLGRVPVGYGLLNSRFCTDSTALNDVYLRRSGYIQHNGKVTWHQATVNLPYIMHRVVDSAGLTLKDIDFFIFHQANKVLINYIMDKHRIPYAKTYTNVERIGNTGAASIGIALSEALERGLIGRNMLLMLVGVGAGFNFGANLWRMHCA